MKIRNTDKRVANAKLNLPIVGEVQLKDGIVDVPADVHKLLVTNGADWEDGEVSKDKTKDATKGGKSTNKDNSGDTEDSVKEMLDALTFDEVKELAEKSKIPKWNMFANKEAALRTYVLNRLKAADEVK